MIEGRDLEQAEALVRLTEQHQRIWPRELPSAPKHSRWLGRAPVLLFRPLAIEQFLGIELPKPARVFHQRALDHGSDAYEDRGRVLNWNPEPDVRRHWYRVDAAGGASRLGWTVVRCSCHHGAIDPEAFEGARAVLERRRALEATDSEWLLTVWKIEKLPRKPWLFPEEA